MKNIRLLALLLLTLTLTGCMRSVRLKDRAIVQAVGVDWAQGRYRLTVQYYRPGSSGEGDSEKVDNGVFTAEGETMSEAVEAATREQGRQVFFGSNKVIVLGQSVARQSITRPIDYFNANHQLHPSMYVLLSEGEAADIVGEPSNKSDAKQIEKLAQTARDHHSMNGGTMLDVVMQLEAGRSAVDIPIIRPKDEDFLIEGAGLFQEGRLVDELSAQEVAGVLWMNGEIGRNLLSVELPQGGRCTLEVLDGGAKKRPRLDESGRLVFEVTLTADCAVQEVESNGQGADGSERELADLAGRLGERKILSLARRAVEKTAARHGADLLEMEEAVRKELPEYYRQHGAQMDRVLEDARFEIKTICRMNRIGLEAAGNKR